MKDVKWILQSGMYSSWNGVSMCRNFDNWDNISLSLLLFKDADVLNVFPRPLQIVYMLYFNGMWSTKFNMQIKQ